MNKVVIAAHNAKYCVTCQPGGHYQVEVYTNHEWRLLQLTNELDIVMKTITEGFHESALKSIELMLEHAAK